MESRFIKWARKRYTDKQRILVLIPLGILFMIVLPYLLVIASRLDERLDLPTFGMGPLTIVIAAPLILIGGIFAIWSNRLVFETGKGTPLPMMPTQKLLVEGPYRYCRNPMAFAAICVYLGFVILIGSCSSMILLFLLITALLTYIRLVEEKELEARFGQEYAEYKKRVPFLIPLHLG